MNKLKEHLKERGYFFYQQAYGNSLVDWYAAKRAETTRECTCNERAPQIIVTPSVYTFSDYSQHRSVSIDLTAEYNDIWWKLSAYSLSEEDAIERLSEIEKKLVKAWEAL